MAEIIQNLLLILVGINIGVIIVCIAHMHFLGKANSKKLKEKGESKDE